MSGQLHVDVEILATGDVAGALDREIVTRLVKLWVSSSLNRCQLGPSQTRRSGSRTQGL